jgi:hypothetical protein
MRVPTDASDPTVTVARTLVAAFIIPGGDLHVTAVFEIHVDCRHVVLPTLMATFELATPKLKPVIVTSAPPLVGKFERTEVTAVTTGASYWNAGLFRNNASFPL